MEFRREDFAAAEALWREWNDRINVVSRKDIDSLFEHHILHSLAISEYLLRKGEISLSEGLDPCTGVGLSFLDVGTGGGFPGIPLAIALPGASFTLCDSIGKKILVASSVASGLGLPNVKCLNCRAEAVEGRFDWVVSRAVTSLDNFYPWVRNKFNKGILYLKGGDIEAEISTLCRKFGLDRSSIGVWPISDWLSADYFKEKFVIDIRK